MGVRNLPEGKTHPFRMLIVGLNAEGSLEGSYFRGLQAARVKRVEFFDLCHHQYYLPGSRLVTRGTNRLLSSLSSWLVRRQFLKFLSCPARKFDVIVVFKGADFSRKALEACHSIQSGAMWININPDDPLNIGSRSSTNARIIDSLSFYDVYCTWSRALVPRLKRRMCRRVEYLPFGYDPEFHVCPDPLVPVKTDGISFVGSWDQEREAALTELASYDLRIYGNGWTRVAKRSPLYRRIVVKPIFGKELAQVIHGSIISLNLLRPQNLGAHNMRTFEIPAMGGLMLTTRTMEQNEFFPEEESCLMFDNVKELRAQLDRAITNQAWAQRLRLCGSKRVREHSYTNRARRLLEIIREA
jgi:spore maturation protein CgeB